MWGVGRGVGMVRAAGVWGGEVGWGGWGGVWGGWGGVWGGWGVG